MDVDEHRPARLRVQDRAVDVQVQAVLVSCMKGNVCRRAIVRFGKLKRGRLRGFGFLMQFGWIQNPNFAVFLVWRTK